MTYLLVLGMLGCGWFDSPPAKAAAIANEIGGDPARAEAVLKKHNLSKKRFDDLMYLIALDRSLTQSYIDQRVDQP